MNQVISDRVTRFARRSNEVLVLSAVTGAVTGLAVAGFEWVVGEGALATVLGAPLWVQLLVPGLGLALTAASLRWLAGGASPSTSDEYIKNFHDRGHTLQLRPAFGRLVGSAATLGSGGALGFEGPSMYLGSVVGTGLQERFRRSFALSDAKVLMVAGAAAGVAAIFKTPATGAIFALEVPYQDDTAKHMLLPALIGAVTGYVTFVAVNGTEVLFPVEGSPPFGGRELVGAALLGVLAGVAARGFAAAIGWAKRLQVAMRPAIRIPLASVVFAALVAVTHQVFGESLALGGGYDVIDWLRTDQHAWWMVALLLVLRTAATTTTVVGGGASGLFVPLVAGGALIGQLCGAAIDEPTAMLFPVIGVAAFLGAGYRTPLAAVMFVAESTGAPGFIVPGLIATVVAQLFMGTASVSGYQLPLRLGAIEPPRATGADRPPPAGDGPTPRSGG